MQRYKIFRFLPVKYTYINNAECYLCQNILDARKSFNNWFFRANWHRACKKGSKQNYTLNHLIERIKYYNEEKFSYEIIQIKI